MYVIENGEQYVLFCVRLHFSTTIWVVLKRKRMQNKTLLYHFQLCTFYLYIMSYFSHLII